MILVPEEMGRDEQPDSSFFGRQRPAEKDEHADPGAEPGRFFADLPGSSSTAFLATPAVGLSVGTTVLLVESDAELRQELRHCLPSDWAVQAFSSLDEADGARIEQNRPTVLLLGPSQVTEAALSRTSSTLRVTEGAGALMVVSSVPPDLMGLVLRTGINDAISLQSAAEHLQEAVVDLARRLESELSRPRRTATSAAGLADARPGYVTTVYSPKGGVGKSVVAVNLAAALAQRTGDPVVIADLDLQFGDVAVMLRLQPRHSLADAASAGDFLDEALLKTFLARHDKSGVWVLAAPTSPSDADMTSPADMLRVLDLLRDMFPYVVLDTPPHLSELVLQAVAASDTVAFVVGMDVPSVKNAHLGLQAFELLQVQREKLAVVLNRADSKVHLTWHDIERALETKVDVGFPSEVTVPQAINQGQPALIAYPRSRFAVQSLQLADLVLARAQKAQTNPRRR
ncbi:MAG: AAA family ATPase [Acidimicrobiales bacterium]